MSDNFPLFLMIICVVGGTLLFLAYTLKNQTSQQTKDEVDSLRKTQEQIAENLKELSTKVASIEKMLREID